MRLAAWARKKVHPVETPMVLGLVLMMGAILTKSMLVAGVASATILLTAAANLLAARPEGQPQPSNDGKSLLRPEAYERF